MSDHPQIVIYNGKLKTRLDEQDIWLTQAQLATLYQTTRENITQHIQNIFKDGELIEASVCKNFLHTANDGKNYNTKFYNLDAIISLGYRINSRIATDFRKWATSRLSEYIVKGFTLDDDRLKEVSGGNYFKELLDRIRDIRSSEKVMYRQVLDLFATAIDYDGKSDTAIMFFKTIQNKLHYAAHGQTAAETIYYRVDADKPYVGLTVFKGEEPTMPEALIAKNYLDEKELKTLAILVSRFFDRAELAATEGRTMAMSDYDKMLNQELASVDKRVLIGAGKISNNRAIDKAKKEFRKYESKTLDATEKTYLQSIKELEKVAKQARRGGAK